MSLDRKDAQFPNTRWTLIERIRDDADSARSDLENTCRHYWPPVYGFARSQGLPPTEAEDLTQEFFMKLIDGGILGNVSPEKGKLRSYIMVCVKNLMQSRARHDAAEKRGGNRVVSTPVEEMEELYRADWADHESPERALERRWALATLAAAMERLKKEYDKRGDGAAFNVLSKMIADCDWGSGYREAAESLGMAEGAVRARVFRLRKRYREVVRELVAETVDETIDVDDEIRFLTKALSRETADPV